MLQTEFPIKYLNAANTISNKKQNAANTISNTKMRMLQTGFEIMKIECCRQIFK